MSALLTAITTTFTSVIGMVGTVGETVVGDDLLVLMVVAIPLCGIAIGAFKRLISL